MAGTKGTALHRARRPLPTRLILDRRLRVQVCFGKLRALRRFPLADSNGRMKSLNFRCKLREFSGYLDSLLYQLYVILQISTGYISLLEGFKCSDI